MVDYNEKERFSLKKFLFGKIGRKITISFVIFSFFMALLGTFIYYINTTSSLYGEIENHLLDTVTSRTNHIETYFDQDIERINLVTSRTQLKIDIGNYVNQPNEILRKGIVAKLNDSRSSIEEIEDICFIGTDGMVMACGNGNFDGIDFSGQDFFTNGLKKEGAYFFKDSGVWKIIVSAPISPNGKLAGIIITMESFDELAGIVKDRTGLGRSGEVLVAFIDKDENVVYPIPRLFENETVAGTDIAVPMKDALQGQSIILDSALDYRGVSVIAATKYIPNLRMGVVAKIDEKEIKLPIQYKFFGISILIIILVLICFLFLGGYISNKITKPIDELANAEERVKNKDFKARVNIKTGDELEELGEAFNSTTEVLENLDKERNQVDKAKTEFLSITSHELRSPMTPMKAQLQMVLGDYFGKLNKEQRESLDIVLRNTERLDKIIMDFLEISRIEAARLKFNFVRADLSKTIDSVVDEMKNFMPEKKIKIETKIDKLPIIEVDPDRISQVLRNLVNNAIKFTPENGKVEISAKPQEKMILFSVRDNGVGIAEKDKRRLFEPFYQADNMYQHKTGGTGLGLAISKGIVESQNGKIWFNSQVGKGSIFYFTIPLVPVKEIKPIKILFSEKAEIEKKVLDIFAEMLGPIGTNEFEVLMNKEGISNESVRKYIKDLVAKKIIIKEKGEEFKNKVSSVFGKGEKEE